MGCLVDCIFLQEFFLLGISNSTIAVVGKEKKKSLITCLICLLDHNILISLAGLKIHFFLEHFEYLLLGKTAFGELLKCSRQHNIFHKETS